MESESEPESEPCNYFKVESESESESECKAGIGIGVGAGTIRNSPSLAHYKYFNPHSEFCSQKLYFGPLTLNNTHYLLDNPRYILCSMSPPTRWNFPGQEKKTNIWVLFPPPNNTKWGDFFPTSSISIKKGKTCRNYFDFPVIDMLGSNLFSFYFLWHLPKTPWQV